MSNFIRKYQQIDWPINHNSLMNNTINEHKIRKIKLKAGSGNENQPSWQ
jgi:hypothetical protein